MTRLGAEYLFVITNDAWFLDKPGTFQHAEMAALRAIETRRYVIQGTNSGVTTVIDPYGRVVSSIEVLKRGILYEDAYRRHGTTFFVRFGDVFVWLCMAASVAGIAVVAVSARKRASKAG
jgi:apolipoprotein N-acyltransferase